MNELAHTAGMQPAGVDSAETIGLIGVGLMGAALAELLLRGGFGVKGWDIDTTRSAVLMTLGGQAAGGLSEVLGACRRVLLSLPNLDVVADVLRGVSSGLRKGQIIIDTSTGDPEQAEALGRQLAGPGIGYLSWLIHLVGDIHQPLHCVSLVYSDYPGAHGDKGGNDFFVKPNTKGVNLHGVWDKALGSTVNARSQYNDAIEISTAHPRKNLLEISKNKSAKTWSKEGRQIALESAYLDGKLKGSTKAGDAPPLPEGYTKNLKQVAERRAAIAGYGLADEIKKSSPLIAYRW